MNKSHKYQIRFILCVIIIISVWLIEMMYFRIVPFMDKWTQPFVPYFADTLPFFQVVTKLGSKSWLIPFVISMIVIFIILYKRLLPAAIFGTAVVMSHVSNKMVKAIVQRERPSVVPDLDAVGYSFPSGHAMVSIVCYSLVAYFLIQKIQSEKIALLVRYFFILIIILIGFSRYVVHVHFLTDILVGYCFGWFIYYIFVQLYEKYK